MRKTPSIFLIAFSMLFLLQSCNNYGKEKSFNGVQLFYTSKITEDEANKLGEYLIESDFADGQKKTVQITKRGNTYEFRMVVKKGVEQDQQYAIIFKQFASQLSNNVFNNSQVDLHACNENLETLRVFPMINY